MTEHILRIETDGLVHGLYTEAIDLQQLGGLTVQRASHVEFDETGQEWIVRTVDGRQLFKHPSRAACLEWERRHFNEQH